MRRCLLWCLLVLAGCSAAETREPIAPVIVEDEPDQERTYEISRREYEEVLKQGLQKVMRWYFVKPHYVKSAFVGFGVQEVVKEELKKGPLRPGDIILTVNDLPIERPEHAMAVWRGLWSRKRLKLSLLRKGRKVVLEIPIVESQPDE